jgi:hypothetical protein
MRHRNLLNSADLVLPALALVCALLAMSATARATTAPHLSTRIVLDGNTQDFEADETIFGPNGAHTSVEPATDSKWGSNEELTGIRITWDRQNLYLAGEGVTWGNNMVLLLDVVPSQGLSSMVLLNSWRRNITFSPDFAPDVFLATWDQNLSPRLLLQIAGDQVDDQVVGPLFQAASSFDQGATGRAMEARIPWTTLFSYSTHGTPIVRDTTIAGQPDTVVYLPAGTQVRIAAVLTAGADGTGGPDVAPDNSTGCSADANAVLLVDNFAIVEIDGDGDGLPDMGASPVTRVTFKDLSLPAHRSTWGQVKARYR